jgi:FAD/FMN-containing dehydrogenase
MESETIIGELRRAAGSDYVHAGKDIEPRYLQDWFIPISSGAPLAVVRPGTTEAVSAVLRVCHDHRISVVPQGGRTGLTGGATPVANGVVLSLERLTGVEEIDSAAATMTVRAGTTLQAVQSAADDAGFLFPLDLGARGSCQIGGNIATNAGGNRVIRYGMMRELVLGLEAVLPDGTVVGTLNKMLKNNTGYDVKQLFIGSEGTLGVVTRAVLRLYPRPQSACAALCAVEDFAQALALLRLAKESLGGTLSAFEMMWPDFYELVTQTVSGLTSPLRYGYGGYVLIETLGSEQQSDQARFEAMLERALERRVIADAAVSKAQSDIAAFWRIRDASAAFPQIFWPHVKFDISIPIGDIGRFVESCKARIHQSWPHARTVTFGHIGDSNIHFNIKVGDGEQPEEEIERIVYDAVQQWHGSISAEHGIGLLKREYLRHSRTPPELELMRRMKSALDPQGIMNPGKIFLSQDRT